jgi:DNA-binding transcriptional regulator YiaG
MYTTAELFIMATDPAASREVFLNSVTLSTSDDADGCVDLDVEKERLSLIWELAHLSMREMVARTGLSQTAFAKRAGVPLRTVQDWCGEKRACPAYVRFLLAEHYNRL